MPDDQNVPVGGAGQTHSARVNFASDTVREKVGDLLAEAGGTLAAVNEDERRRVARRLRKAKGATPSGARRRLAPQHEQPALRLVAQQQDGAGARAVGHHRHIADAADLPVEDDTLGFGQPVRTEHHQIEPPEF